MERDRRMALAELSQKNEARRLIAAESREVLTQQMKAATRPRWPGTSSSRRTRPWWMTSCAESRKRTAAIELKMRKQAETRAYIRKFQEEHALQVAEAKRKAAEEEAKIEATERSGRTAAPRLRRRPRRRPGGSPLQGSREQVRKERLEKEELARRGELAQARGEGAAHPQAPGDEEGDDRG